MPAKDTTDDCSSSDGSDVEYVYQGESVSAILCTNFESRFVLETSILDI